MNWPCRSSLARIKLTSFTTRFMTLLSCNTDVQRDSWWMMQRRKITSWAGLSFLFSFLFRSPTIFFSYVLRSWTSSPQGTFKFSMATDTRPYKTSLLVFPFRNSVVRRCSVISKLSLLLLEKLGTEQHLLHRYFRSVLVNITWRTLPFILTCWLHRPLVPNGG